MKEAAALPATRFQSFLVVEALPTGRLADFASRAELIAGISILDAIFIVVVWPQTPWLALVAALGFPLTLLLQRWVPGD